MMTAEEYLNENVKPDDWDKIQGGVKDGLWTNNVLQYMREFAKAAIEEQLIIAATEATIESETLLGKWHPEYNVDKDSILNCTRVTIL